MAASFGVAAGRPEHRHQRLHADARRVHPDRAAGSPTATARAACSRGAIAIFTLASLLCGLATALAMFVAMRVLQGIGGAMMVPVGPPGGPAGDAEGPADPGDRHPHLAGAGRAGARAAAGRLHRRPCELALDLLPEPAARPDRLRARPADRARTSRCRAHPRLRLARLPAARRRRCSRCSRPPSALGRREASPGARPPCFAAAGVALLLLRRAPPAARRGADDRPLRAAAADLRGHDLGRLAVPHRRQRGAVPAAADVPARLRLRRRSPPACCCWRCSRATSR